MSGAFRAFLQVRRTWAGHSRSSSASRGINDGYVLMAPSTRTSPRACSGRPGYATAAFVLPRPGAEVKADIDRVIDGIATAGPPRPHQPAMLANASQSFNLNLMSGILVGFLIALNTILLAVEDRRAVMGTIGAIWRQARSDCSAGCSARVP